MDCPKESKVELTSLCELVRTEYCEGVQAVELQYTERSQDYWHSDQHTDIEIDEEKAKEIIAFLRESFGL